VERKEIKENIMVRPRPGYDWVRDKEGKPKRPWSGGLPKQVKIKGKPLSKTPKKPATKTRKPTKLKPAKLKPTKLKPARIKTAKKKY
jgi:hypothetical protein